jgi:hypothetical protein
MGKSPLRFLCRLKCDMIRNVSETGCGIYPA